MILRIRNAAGFGPVAKLIPDLDCPVFPQSCTDGPICNVRVEQRRFETGCNIDLVVRDEIVSVRRRTAERNLGGQPVTSAVAEGFVGITFIEKCRPLPALLQPETLD